MLTQMKKQDPTASEYLSHKEDSSLFGNTFIEEKECKMVLYDGSRYLQTVWKGLYEITC